MAEKLKMRKDVPTELKWNLALLYRTQEDVIAAEEELERLCADIEGQFKGKLNTAQDINACLDELARFNEIEARLGNYSELLVSVDYNDAPNQEISARIGRRLDKTVSRLKFIRSEIVGQSEDVLKEAMRASDKNRPYIEEVLRDKPHRFCEETERVLAALGGTLNAAYTVYDTAKLADMIFPDFTAGGKTYPLGYSLFEDNYEYEPCTEVRRNAFSAFSAKIKEYENVTAAAYNTQVQKEKTMSELRGFDCVYDSLLFGQKVDRKLYDRQIDLIMEDLAPHMRKYARLLQRIHKLGEMTYADLKLPVDAGYVPEVTIEESKNYIKKGLAILGDDYVRMIDTAYQERWIDFAQNYGKSTGGFCASPYGANSFILLNWHNKMSDVFTLAHELGHAGHFKACNSAQSIFGTDVSTYFVEAPSTMNELLLGHYLLKTNDDKRFRRWVLSNMIGNTYYHNFVTHLLEAAYQREVYRRVDAGKSVRANTLSAFMKDTLSRFWGGEVELCEGAELTWMRQPHYYMGLYSYTYSAGLTIATQVCKRIEKEGAPAVEDWKKVLAAGGTKTPVELAAMAGIDITTDEPLLDTIETIGGMIDEICALTDALEKQDGV